MVKLTVLYNKPSNPQEFDRYYHEVHIPLVNKLAGLQKIELAKVLGSPFGESDYHLMANLYFDNLESLKSALSSEEGKATAKDVKNFADAPVQMMICEIH